MRRPSAVSVAHHRIDFPSPSSNRFPRPPPRSLPGHSMLRTFHSAGIIGTVGEQPRCSLTALRHCSSAYSSVRVHRLGASARWESCASVCRRGAAPVTPVAAGVVWAHCTRVGCCWRRGGGVLQVGGALVQYAHPLASGSRPSCSRPAWGGPVTEAPGRAVRTPDSLLRGLVSTVLTSTGPASVRPAEIVGILRFFFVVWRRCACDVSTLDTHPPSYLAPRPPSPPGSPACAGFLPERVSQTS